MTRPKIAVLLAPILFAGSAAAEPDGLVAYWPFDGTPAIALGCASGWTPPTTELAYGDGVSGQSVRLVSDCRFGMRNDFPVAEGTFAAWIQPEFSASTDSPRYILCLYGNRDSEPAYARNRWSLVAYGSRLSFAVYGESGGKPLVAEATAPNVTKKGWHHVAATWSGLNSPTQAAVLHLYFDGAPIASATAPRLKVGETSGQLDLGRDSDNSPDYGEMRLDDAFLYARALHAEEIAAGFTATAPGKLRPAPERRVAGACPSGWDAPGLPFRVTLEATASKRARIDWSLYAAPALSKRLHDLGRAGVPDLSRARLFAPKSERDWQEVAFQLDGRTLSWPTPGNWPAGKAKPFRLYFDTLSYSHVAPLVVARPLQPDRTVRPAAALPDYAQVEYGDAWDFDEGDSEEIDSFGNKPEMIRDVRVVDGALHAKVSHDPYIIWGSMWGPEDRGKRRVHIDLAQYPMLVLRLRQSVASATWKIFGRPAGSENLLTYEFHVAGTGWQTVRVDLAREAKWSGVLSAFRINLTKDVDADVDLDFVRLVRSSEARMGTIETPGNPSAQAKKIALTPDTQTPVAGTSQRLQIRVEDGSGKPVSSQPVRVWLTGENGSELEVGAAPSLGLSPSARRALTDANGKIEVRLLSGPKAGGAAQIHAEAEFTKATGKTQITIQAGPPSQYETGVSGVRIVPETETPLRIQIFAADACGNPVPLPGRKLTWSIADARQPEGSCVTTAEGAEVVLQPDLSRRWVYRVHVKDDQGREGESGDICVLPKGPPPAKVTLKDNSFRTPDGHPFVPLGGFYAVWIPRIPEPGREEGRQNRAFTDASEEEMHHWFGFLRSQGVTALRMMLRTHGAGGTEAMDVGGRVNRKLFARVLRLIDIARQYDLRFLLTLHDDYSKPVYVNEQHLERFALPAFVGEDLGALPAFQRRFLLERDLVSPHDRYLDPDAIACQDQYAREIVGYLKDNPALFAWELENEMVDCPVSWVNHAVETIRSVDPVTPVCVSHGGGGLVTADPLYWTRTKVDFYTYHLYPVGTTTAEMDYGLVTDALTRYGRMSGTCFFGESTGDEFSQYPAERDDDRRWIMRDLIWFSLVNRNPGCFFWNARGKEIGEYQLASKLLRSMPWLLEKRPPAPVAVRLAHPLDKDTWYRSPDGRRDLAMMVRYSKHFLERGVEFDFVMDGGDGGNRQTCDLSKFAPPDAPARFTPSPGFQIASATNEGGREGLLYVRCVSGIRSWSPKPGQTMWLRERAPAALRLQCRDPKGIRTTICDLDSGAERKLAPGGDGVLDLGVTDHDFAVLWEQENK